MTNSPDKSKQPSTPQSKKKPLAFWIALIIVVVAFLGFADATYLSVTHYNSAALVCGDSSGCHEVTSSKWSTIFGVPVALGGAFYYLTMLVLAIAYFDRKEEKFLRLAGWFSIAGLAASAYFVILQLFVIKAICYYCMASAGTSTILFLTGMYWLSQSKK